MRKQITGILIDPHIKCAEEKIMEDTLESYYTNLHCTCIDIVSRRIGDNDMYFCIVCDDDGLFDPDAYVTAIDNKSNPMLVGALFICAGGDNGELRSLTEQEISYIKGHIRPLFSINHETGYLAVCDVRY